MIFRTDTNSYSAKQRPGIVLGIVTMRSLLRLAPVIGTQSYGAAWTRALLFTCNSHFQLYHPFITGWWVYAALCRGGWLYCCLNAHSGGAGQFNRYCRCDASPPYVSTAFSMVNFVPCRLYYQNPLVATLAKSTHQRYHCNCR